MAKNLKFFFDSSGQPCARGPLTEKVLVSFLETDVQGDDHICHDLMEDIVAIEENAAESREFSGNAHLVTITPEGITIVSQHSEPEERYETGLKHFKQTLEDWEAFILDESAPV